MAKGTVWETLSDSTTESKRFLSYLSREPDTGSFIREKQVVLYQLDSVLTRKFPWFWDVVVIRHSLLRLLVTTSVRCNQRDRKTQSSLYLLVEKSSLKDISWLKHSPILTRIFFFQSEFVQYSKKMCASNRRLWNY